MSVVVAIKNKGVIYMGCDSQISCGGTRTTLKNENNYKIRKVIGVDNCLMGSVGNLRDACIIRTLDDLISDYDVYKNYVGFDYVVRKIVPEIISALQDARYLKKDGVFDYMDSSYLFAFKGQLFQISTDGSVFEIEDCVAIGSGKNEAIGSLLSTEDLNAEERIVKAIKASAANDLYVDYPIILTKTSDTEFKIIYEKNEKEYLENNRRTN